MWFLLLFALLVLAGPSRGAPNYTTVDIPCVTSVTTRTDVTTISSVVSSGFSSTSTATSAPGSLVTAPFTLSLQDGLSSAAGVTPSPTATTLTTSSPGSTSIYVETAFCIETIVQCGSFQTTLASVPFSGSQPAQSHTRVSTDLISSTESSFLGTSVVTSWPDSTVQTSTNPVDGYPHTSVFSESDTSTSFGGLSSSSSMFAANSTRTTPLVISGDTTSAKSSASNDGSATSSHVTVPALTSASTTWISSQSQSSSITSPTILIPAPSSQASSTQGSESVSSSASGSSQMPTSSLGPSSISSSQSANSTSTSSVSRSTIHWSNTTTSLAVPASIWTPDFSGTSVSVSWSADPSSSWNFTMVPLPIPSDSSVFPSRTSTLPSASSTPESTVPTDGSLTSLPSATGSVSTVSSASSSGISSSSSSSSSTDIVPVPIPFPIPPGSPSGPTPSDPLPTPPPGSNPPSPPPGGNPPGPPPGGNPPSPTGVSPPGPDPGNDPDDPDSSGDPPPGPPPGGNPPGSSGGSPPPSPPPDSNPPSPPGGSSPDPNPGDDPEDPDPSDDDPPPGPPPGGNPPGSSGGNPPPGPPPGGNPPGSSGGSPSPTSQPTPTTAPTAIPTESKDGECTTSAVASCLEEVHVLTEYFTLSNGVSTSTVETSTETSCISVLTCEGDATTTTTTTSSSTSDQPTATCTAQLIVPQYEAKLDDASYFVPLCKSGSQTLWRNDGTSLKIDCKGITFSTGESFQIPVDLSNATDSKCHDVASNGVSVCYSKRFPNWNATQDTVDIPAGRSENAYSNITSIAEALETVGNNDGLAEVGCGSSGDYSGVAAYYFGRVQTPLEEITSSDQSVTDFYHDISSSSQNVTSRGGMWIPQADEMLQNLMCHIDTSDGRSSGLVRALSKQSTLHTGINTLVSIANVDKSQKSLRSLIKDLFDNYVSYIGRESSIIQGWTQAYRLCLTKWDEVSLSNPSSQKPIRDDIDGWYAAYSIIASPGTTMDELRGLEYALGVEGSETAPADGNPDLWKSYTADLNLVQATLPDFTTFVNLTSRFVWDGESADKPVPFEGAGVPETDPDPSKKSRQSSNTANLDTARSNEFKKQDSGHAGFGKNESRGQHFDQLNFKAPTEYPPPNANAQSAIGLTGKNHLKLISQQKGQAPPDFYRFAPREGEGSWIFIIDEGFDLNHEYLADKRRDNKIKRWVFSYVVPNDKVLPAPHPDQVADGWFRAPEEINDNMPDQKYGHGTGVACVAAATSHKVGVASNANLYLIKWSNFYMRYANGQAEKRRGFPQHTAYIDTFTRIYNAFLPPSQKGGGIDSRRTVINISGGALKSDYVLQIVTDWFRTFDQMGVTIVFAMGNFGFDENTKKPSRYQADSIPEVLATSQSSYISVGGVYHDGSLWEGTTPPGSAPGVTPPSDAMITLFAQAVEVRTCESNAGPKATYLATGCSFAAPQVAGLAAALLSYPWPQGQNPFDPTLQYPTIGWRMKYMLSQWYAYQRLPHNQIVNKAMKKKDVKQFPWEFIPNYVPVIYNYVYGDQRCKRVNGFPNPPPGVGYPCPQLASGGGGGNGGGGTVGPDDDGTGTVFYTNDPTYLPSGWSGFSTVTTTADNSSTSMSTTSASFNSSITSPGSSESFSTVSKTSTTTSSSTSAVASSTPSSAAAWTLSLFEKPDCQGDHYNFTGLSNDSANYCINKPGELSTDRGNVSCTYGSVDPGHAHCAGGPWPLKPKSWALKNNICTSFRDTECKLPLKNGISYDSSIGCTNAPVDADLSFIESLSCSPNTPSCKTCIKCRNDCWESAGQGIQQCYADCCSQSKCDDCAGYSESC